MPRLINVPGRGVVSFPDGMTNDQIEQAIKNNVTQTAKPTPMSQPEAALTSLANAGRKSMYGLLQPFWEGGAFGDEWAQKSKQWNAMQEARSQQASDEYPWQSALSNTVGEAALAYALPFTKAKTVLGTLGKMAGVNAALGLGQSVPEGGSRVFNGALNAATSFAFPGSTMLANKLADVIHKPATYVAQQVMGGIDNVEATIARKAAGERIGVDLTPAEASGSPLAGSTQGKLGQSRKGSAKAQELNEARLLQEKKAIGGLMDDVSKSGDDYVTLYHGTKPDNVKSIMQSELKQTGPYDKIYQDGFRFNNQTVTDNPDLALMHGKGLVKIQIPKSQVDDYFDVRTYDDGSKAYGLKKPIPKDFITDASKGAGYESLSPQEAVRRTTQKIFKNKKDALEAQAEPYYEKARRQEVDPQVIEAISKQDGTIEKAINETLADPHYRADMEGYPANSIKVLDLAKRRIDAQIKQAKGNAMTPGNDDLVRVLTDSKKRLVGYIDSVSDDYKTARKIYGEGAIPLKQLRDSPIGKLASLDDRHVKDVAKTIFDPGQTDPKVLRQIQREISKESPETWQRITRQYMENALDGTDVKGSIFYNKFLKSDRKFNQLMIALDGNPAAQQKLGDMREAFKHLINPRTPRAAATLSATSMSGPRESVTAVKKIAIDVIGAKYDEAAVELIHSKKWDQELKAIRGIKDSKVRNMRRLDILNKILSQKESATANEIFTEKEDKQ